MKWPPYLLKLKIRSPQHSFGIWLPLFLLWPIILVFLLAAFLILLPFALLAIIFTWQLGYWRPLVLGIPALLRIFWSAHGLTVDVEEKDNHVKVEFF